MTVVAQRVGRGIALLFHDRGTRRGWVVSSMPRPHFNPGKDPVPIVQEAVWAPGRVWTEYLVTTGIRFPTLQPVVSRYTDWPTRPTDRNEYQEYFLGGKGGRCVRLTTLPPSCTDCLEIWERQPPGTLRTCPGLYRNCCFIDFFSVWSSCHFYGQLQPASCEKSW